MGIHSAFGDVFLHIFLACFSLATSIVAGIIIGSRLGYASTATGHYPWAHVDRPSPPPTKLGCLLPLLIIGGLPCIACIRQLSTNGYNKSIQLVLLFAGLLPFIAGVVIGFMASRKDDPKREKAP